MTTNELIERYIYAATKNLGQKKIREDIGLELQTLIDDMLLERCGNFPPEEKDVRVVLAEIGTPAEVHRKYSPHSNKSLISEEYYPSYIYILKIISAILVGGLFIAHFIMFLQGDIPTIWSFFLELFPSLITSFCGFFTILTIVFAICQHKHVAISAIDNSLDLNALPPVPKKKEAISRGECICGIIFAALFTVIFLFVPQIMGFSSPEYGFVPVFNLTHLRDMWFFILALGAIGIFDECLRLFEGRYTLKVLVSNLVSNALSLIFALAIFAGNDIMNPLFVTKLQSLTATNMELLASGKYQINMIILGVIILGMLIDTADNVYHYFKHRNN